jgi:hypothetical protein
MSRRDSSKSKSELRQAEVATEDETIRTDTAFISGAERKAMFEKETEKPGTLLTGGDGPMDV